MKTTLYWAGLALCAGNAAAQADLSPQAAQTDVTRLPTVTVTATKREQDVADIAGNVAAASARDLAPRGLQSVDQLDRVFTDMHIRQRSSRAYANATIRGQSSPDFYNPAAQLYVDGLPQDQALFTQLLPQALEQVEILYGPQGTLYGRGAVGGVISIVTRKPDNTLRAEAGVTIDAPGRGAQLLLNLPLADQTWFGDIALGSRSQRGEMRDMTNGQRLGDGDDQHARLRLRYAPAGGRLDAMLTVARDKVSSEEEYFVVGPDLAARRALPVPSHYQLDTDSVGLHLAFALGALKLLALSGYQDRDFDRTIFGSATPETQRTFSQEFKLVSTPGQAVGYVAGLYYQNLDFSRAVPAAALTSRQAIRSLAAYGEATWHATDRLDVTPGLRVEREHARADTRFADTTLQRDKTFHAVSPKLGVNYRLGRDLSLYGLYSTGFKAGGFTRAVTPDNIAFTYQPQKTANLEAGFKARLPQYRLELNGAAYAMRTSDYQLSVGPVQGQYLQNVGRASTRGVSLDARWQASTALYLKAGIAVNRSLFSHYDNAANPGIDLSGKRLPYAPQRSANLAAEYRIALADGASLVPHIGLSHVGTTYFDEANTSGQDRYTVFDAGLSWQVNRSLSADVYLDNVTDRTYAVYGFQAGAPYGALYQVGKGRTAGARLHVRF